MSDEELMARVNAGDRESLSELFRRHQKPLFNYFLRGFGNAEDAEDLTMETLMRVFRHAAHFQGGGSFRAWLYHLALNVARDRSRRNKRRPEVPASAVEEMWTAVEDDREDRRPEQMALRGDLAAAVRAAVRELPEKERGALTLREYQQFSYEEIAVALKTTVPAVKMLLHRARKRVRARLEKTGRPELRAVCP